MDVFSSGISIDDSKQGIRLCSWHQAFLQQKKAFDQQIEFLPAKQKKAVFPPIDGNTAQPL